MNIHRLAVLILLLLIGQPAFAAGGGSHGEGDVEFPRSVESYNDSHLNSTWEVLKHRVSENPFNLVVTGIFLLAIFHILIGVGFFQKWHHSIEEEHKRMIKEQGRTAQAKGRKGDIDDVSFKARVVHYLGEVEVVFPLWVLVLGIAMTVHSGLNTAKNYINGVDYTEPIFVVAVMAIAATRPVLRLAEKVLGKIAGIFGGSIVAWWFSVLTFGPLFGSLITEPAAMTLCALLLARKFYDSTPTPSPTFAYATLGLLFVNISVGGALTHFAAPPVLMVAEPWGWGIAHMFTEFGWKAVIGVLISNALYFVMFKKELSGMKIPAANFDSPATPYHDRIDPIPFWVTGCHLLALGVVVFFAHYWAIVMLVFVGFIGFTEATEHHQNKLAIKPAILVGLFLAGLKIHGDLQGWWISPVLGSLKDLPMMFTSTGLTAFNDNAAITYLATKVQGLSDAQKYFVVAGAITGGGLTVIANAPNPAGQSILKRYFNGGVNPLKLFLAALIPTIVMGLCFILLP